VKKSHIVTITVVATLLVVSAAAVLVKIKFYSAAKPAIVNIAKPERGDLVEFVSAPGEIEPKSNVEISAKISGRIVEMPYDEGDTVTAGDPNADPPIPPSILLKLDSKDLESQLLSARASRAAQAAQSEVETARIASQQAALAGLQASLRQAERDLERQQKLLDTTDISKAVFEKAKLAVDELKSQLGAAEHTRKAAELNLTVLNHTLEAADARIDQAQDALSYTTIKSPINGVITRINAEVGEVVITGTMNNPGTVIMEVGDLSQMLLVAQVDESDVAKLQPAQKAKIHIDAFPDREFDGVVDSIALSHTKSFTGTKYYRTEIPINPTDVKLYSGLTAHVDIETRKHADVLKLPTQAVLGRETDSLPLDIREKSPNVDPNKTYATVVFRYVDGKAVVTPVKIGRSDLTHTIIEQGITENDQIVIGPYKVLEGIKHDQLIIDEREAKAKEKPRGAKNKPDTNDVNNPKNG
jgi:HlyD family secretion protein